MENYVDRLLENIKQVGDCRANAIDKIASILEDGCLRVNGNIHYLTDDDKRLIINKLSNYIIEGICEPFMFWLVGKVSADIGLKPILDVVLKMDNKLDDDTVRQITVVLDNYLTCPYIKPCDYRFLTIIDNPRLIKIMEGWRDVIRDDGYQLILKEVLDKIYNYKSEG